MAALKEVSKQWFNNNIITQTAKSIIVNNIASKVTQSNQEICLSHQRVP